MVQLATPDPEEAAPKPGEVLEGRYRLEGRLGEGGVGWVYRARHLQLGSDVAIKMLQERFAESSMMRPRFTREARAMAALKHPHIVTITDFSVVEGRPYIVMELLEGLSLRDVLEEGPVEPERARRLVARILEGLEYAHAQGFVHRDLKPDNIFLLDLPSDDAFPKILDFGFVKLTGQDSQPQANAEVLTRSGIAFGTPAYMSPEQATGAPADARSDLYALGIILFEMLAGKRPYEGSLPEIVRKHLTAPVPTFADIGAASREREPLRALIAKAMAKEPADRFQSATEMKQALLDLPDHFLRIREDLPDATVSSEAPTVAAVPRSKPPKDSGKRSSMKAAGAAMAAAFVIGGAAVLIALAASWTDEVAPDVPLANAATEPEANQAAETEDEGEELGELQDVAEDPAETEALAEVAEPVPENPAEEAEDEQAAEEALAEGEAIEAPAEQVDHAREERVNPWRSRRALGWFTRARRRVLRGRQLGSRTEAALKRHVRAHRDDPRPHLLLAQSYMNKGWKRSAYQRYDLAYRIDSNAPADPRMKLDLVRMAADSSVQDEAADMVVRVYGSDAVETIDEELATERWAPDARARLAALRGRL